MSDAVLHASGLEVWFERPGAAPLHAVRGIDLRLARGERVGLVGESGCGKTTALLALMGLLPPSAVVDGRLELDGREVLRGGEASIAPHRWKDVAMVFQGAMSAFNPVRRIGEQIVEPMELHGVASGRAARARTAELLELVGIPAGRARSFPHELSGGMRQRAAIAMALACEPAVVLADEPTTALDVMVQAQIVELLRRLSDELGLALVLVTHDLALVGQLCSRAAVMYAGRIVEQGPIEDLWLDPSHPYTRLLFAATPDVEPGPPPITIPGSPPPLDAVLAGCPFASRCDVVQERCTTLVPAPVDPAAARGAACHLAIDRTRA